MIHGPIQLFLLNAILRPINYRVISIFRFFFSPRSEDTKPNLFTCGFDRITLGWSIQPRDPGGAAAADDDKLSLSLKGAKDFSSLREHQAPSSASASAASASASASPFAGVGSVGIGAIGGLRGDVVPSMGGGRDAGGK